MNNNYVILDVILTVMFFVCCHAVMGIYRARRVAHPTTWWFLMVIGVLCLVFTAACVVIAWIV